MQEKETAKKGALPRKNEFKQLRNQTPRDQEGIEIFESRNMANIP